MVAWWQGQQAEVHHLAGAAGAVVQPPRLSTKTITAYHKVASVSVENFGPTVTFLTTSERLAIYFNMAGSSRNASPLKRLMTEIQTYQNDPNDALVELGPEGDDVMHWKAVMKGVIGTAYEGKKIMDSRLSYYLNEHGTKGRLTTV